MRPAKMLREVLGSIFKKPATNLYPAQKLEMPDKFRGKIKFYPERCIGCKMCMRDCPTNAITINKIGENKFEALFDLSKCIYCAQCVDSCPKKALETTKEVELAQLDKNNLRVVYSYKDVQDKPKE
ncbi:MAG: 4Fe-4S binding protein [Candidatus Omnitrophica bacterium]|jgi:formate hydrogenlyase subunit 6/NADH:ubiquinone oxidoreductase subunit I|nr:4Fe-4S binding protein [Candidatus Omnitrophota bacterium]